MDEAQAVNKIEVNLPQEKKNLLQEKITFINNTHVNEVEYWKKVALDNKNEDERKRLTGLSSLRLFLAPEDVVKEVNKC